MVEVWISILKPLLPCQLAAETLDRVIQHHDRAQLRTALRYLYHTLRVSQHQRSGAAGGKL